MKFESVPLNTCGDVDMCQNTGSQVATMNRQYYYHALYNNLKSVCSLSFSLYSNRGSIFCSFCNGLLPEMELLYLLAKFAFLIPQRGFAETWIEIEAMHHFCSYHLS